MPTLGTVQTVVVCIAGSSGIQGACPTGSVESVTQAYMIAPSQASYFDLMADPFDPGVAGQYFGFAFASTVFVWLLALGAGAVIKMVKSA
jgi:hypothetical protein